MIYICKQGVAAPTVQSLFHLFSSPPPSISLGALREVAVSQLAGRDIHSNPIGCGSLQRVVPTVLMAFSQETPLPLNSRYVETKENGGRPFRGCGHGWGRGRQTAWSRGQPHPGALVPVSARDAGGLRRCDLSLCLRSLTVRFGVKTKHRSCTGTQKEPDEHVIRTVRLLWCIIDRQFNGDIHQYHKCGFIDSN